MSCDTDCAARQQHTHFQPNSSALQCPPDIMITTTTDMASISSLPTELFEPIIRLLQDSLSDLSSLSKTSRLLHHRAVPYLFETIVWTYSLPRPEHNTSAPLRQLLQTIITNPSLASCVRNIDFSVASLFTKRICMWELEASAKDFELELDIVSKANFPDPQIWHNALIQGNPDAFIALIIYQLPCLETASLGSPLQEDSVFTPALFRHCLSGQAPNPLPDFHRLRHIKSSLDEPLLPALGRGKDSLNLDDILTLFYVPRVKKIEAIFPPSESPILSWPRVDVNVAPIFLFLTTLNLHISELSEDNLAKLLMSTPNLTHLRYDYFNNPHRCSPQSTKFLDVSKLSSALEIVKHTLESLEIKFTFLGNLRANLWNQISYNSQRQTSGPQGYLAPFIAFDKLKELRVPWRLLLSPSAEDSVTLADILPRQLECFAFSDDHCYGGADSSADLMVEQIRHFLRPGFKEKFPLLTTLTVDAKYGVDYHFAQQKRYWPGWSEAWGTATQSVIEDICHLAGITPIVPQAHPTYADKLAYLTSAPPPIPHPGYNGCYNPMESLPKWLHKKSTYRFPRDFAERLERGERPGKGEILTERECKGGPSPPLNNMILLWPSFITAPARTFSGF